MERKEYDKLLKVAETEFKHPYFFQNALTDQDVFYAEVLGVKFVERERKNYYQLTLREPELSEWQKKLMECELLKKSPLNKF